MQENLFSRFSYNKDSDQPEHLLILFYSPYGKYHISRLATSETSIFKLVSVAEQAGLKLSLLKL